MREKNIEFKQQATQNDMDFEKSIEIVDVVFLGTKDVARCLRCKPETARQIMRRNDFPLIMVGKNMRVAKQAFEAWAMERRV